MQNSLFLIFIWGLCRLSHCSSMYDVVKQDETRVVKYTRGSLTIYYLIYEMSLWSNTRPTRLTTNCTTNKQILIVVVLFEINLWRLFFVFLMVLWVRYDPRIYSNSIKYNSSAYRNRWWWWCFNGWSCLLWLFLWC